MENATDIEEVHKFVRDDLGNVSLVEQYLQECDCCHDFYPLHLIFLTDRQFLCYKCKD